MKDKVILIGGGGHAKSCIDVIEMEGKFEIAGILDVKEKIGEKVFGYSIIGSDDDVESLIKNHKFLITIGHMGDAAKRVNLFNKLKMLQTKFATIISPLAYVSKHAEVREASIVMHHVIINAGASIGENCIINTKALIEHDSKIDDNCHVSTGAIVNGSVKVGSGVFIGSGAVLKQGIVIAQNSFIKANSLVK